MYSDYLFFPGGYTAPTAGKLVSLPLISLPIISTRAECTVSSNRYVFRIARLVHRIASWSDFAKEHSADFDNHTKHEISFARRPYTQF